MNNFDNYHKQKTPLDFPAGLFVFITVRFVLNVSVLFISSAVCLITAYFVSYLFYSPIFTSLGWYFSLVKDFRSFFADFTFSYNPTSTL